MKDQYNRAAAVAYAKKWAKGRNPDYYNFEKLGGDCTNFASQVILAGSGVMNYTPTYGWYYRNLNDRTPSWAGVEYLYNFLVGNKGAGPYAKEVPLSEVEPGDIVQLKFVEGVFVHSPVVVQVGRNPDPSNIMVAAHSFDAWMRPLKGYKYIEARGIHIEAVNR
jgi:hypothetical protein